MKMQIMVTAALLALTTASFAAPIRVLTDAIPPIRSLSVTPGVALDICNKALNGVNDEEHNISHAIDACTVRVQEGGPAVKG
jgi:hypothetical protein